MYIFRHANIFLYLCVHIDKPMYLYTYGCLLRPPTVFPFSEQVGEDAHRGALSLSALPLKTIDLFEPSVPQHAINRWGFIVVTFCAHNYTTVAERLRKSIEVYMYVYMCTHVYIHAHAMDIYTIYNVDMTSICMPDYTTVHCVYVCIHVYIHVYIYTYTLINVLRRSCASID